MENPLWGAPRIHGELLKVGIEVAESTVSKYMPGPTWRRGQGGGGWSLFLRNQSLRLTELGALDARPGAGINDGCRASCVDWYGNSRPLFVNNRVFALMGYEIVEGQVSGNQIAEVQRVSFAPVRISLAH